MGLNLYDIVALENQMERIAQENEGEIPEEMLKELVEAQTKSLDTVERMCKYIRNLELGIENCKAEESRIKAMRDKADNRIKSIKKYMTDYVDKAGKISAGTFTLSIRKSESVELQDGFICDENKSLYRTRLERFPDKTLVKDLLKKGRSVTGAELVQKKNLQIK